MHTHAVGLTAAVAAVFFIASTAMAQTVDAPLPATNFAATHNSYSGNIAGSRGTIPQQLDAGIRFIEYDIHLGDYARNGDYQIGHGSPGSQVDHTPPNPASNDFADWLRMLAAWSDAHPQHAPIALGLDAKNDLSAQSSPAAGNPSALNEELRSLLGARMYTAAQFGDGAWPSANALQGRILVVLSGNQTNRRHYRSDQGRTPAIGANAAGAAIVVYQSAQSSNLWYWYGGVDAQGVATWPIHGKYDAGAQPAVALSDGGVIVEVHKSQSNSGLWSHVGVFRNGQLTWGKSQNFANGSLPSVAWTGDDQVAEIHAGSSGRQRVVGIVDANALTIRWGAPASTTQARYPTRSASAGGLTTTVSTGPGPGGVADTLFAGTPSHAKQRIVYPQTMFTEYQKGDSSQLGDDGLWFYASASGSGNWSWDAQQRKAGRIVRMWAFDSSATGVSTPPNYPATDTPYAGWYTAYCSQVQCRR